MITKQKIKKLIIYFSIMLVLTSLCVFHSSINSTIIGNLFNKFSVISKKDNLLVHFISVGEADAIAINLPDGKTMLIDTGWETYNVSYTDYLTENVINSNVSNKIDYLFLTHAHIDHAGGALRVLKTFDVENLFLPQVESTSQYYTELLDYANENCDYKFISSEINISGEGYSIGIFGPMNFIDANESSPIIKVEYMNTSFLFTGDIGSSTEAEYISAYGDELDCDVLKVAHHGSKNSTSDEFLQVVTPKYSVISVGENSNNHPSDRVIDSLTDVGSKVLRTDENGNVLFVVGKDYNLSYKTGNYWLTGVSLDYRYIILISNFVIVIKVVIIIFEKPKKKGVN